MKKFANMNESINLGKFSISDDEYRLYSKLVNSIKNSMYPENNEIVDGLSLTKALPYETKFGRHFSVLNKANTNRMLMTKFVQNYNINSFSELMNFIKTNKDEIFKDDGKIFPLVWETIRKTEKIGEENEELVADYIKNLVKSKLNKDINVKREVTSSYRDMVLGIDLSFFIDDNEYTCQVKPLKSYVNDGNSISVTSSGRLKEYKTHYISFCNNTTKQVLLFRSKNYSLKEDTYFFSPDDLVII